MKTFTDLLKPNTPQEVRRARAAVAFAARRGNWPVSDVHAVLLALGIHPEIR